MTATSLQCTACGATSAPDMKFCGQCGQRLARAEHAASPAERESAERRHMTVMFCDLVGSTPLAETVDPEELRDVIARFQSVCVGAIEQFDGHVSKYMGDGLLAYFGYPHAHEDDPHRAVYTGLAIIDGVTELNDSLRSQHGVELKVRVGVHTGLVIAGEMGSGQNIEEFAIVGETPNIAARLEAVAEPDTIAVSDVTQRLVDGFFTTESRGQLPLKGVSRPLGVHRVVAATGVVDRLEVTTHGPLTPLIGRTAELDRLVSEWVCVDRGAGVIAHVRGQAGIGKSRVAHALADRLVGARRTTVIWKCSPYLQHSSLHPVTAFLRTWLDLEDAAPDEQIDRIRVATHDAGLDEATTLPLLADLLAVPYLPESAGETLSPIDARAAILSALESMLLFNSGLHPLLIVVEDLHWADPTTLELLNRLVDRVGELPIMGVFTFRPNAQVPWRTPDVDLVLQPLSEQDVAQMIDVATADMDVGPDLSGRVATAASGIPLFVEEMVRMLAGRQADTTAGGSDLDDDLTVPATLRGLLTERLDRLAEAKPVAEVASVLGDNFRADVLARVLDVPDSELTVALDRLTSANIVTAVNAAGPTRYEFAHALMQETAYSTLLRRRRRDVHRRAAEVLITDFGSTVAGQPEVIAQHFARAGDHSSAVEYWRLAGERAVSAAAFLEAADHFRNGCESVEELDPSPSQDRLLVEFLTSDAAARQAALGYAEPSVGELYQRARVVCDRIGDDEVLMSVLRGQWHFELIRGNYEGAKRLATLILSLGERRHDPSMILEGHTFIGMCSSFLSDLPLARSHLEQAIEGHEPSAERRGGYQNLGDPFVMAHAYLAPVLWQLGLIDESAERSDRSLELLDHTSTPITTAQAWGMRSLYHLGRKEVGLAAEWSRKVVALCEERPMGYWHQLMTIVNGWCIGRTEDLRIGLDIVEDSLSEYLRAGSRLGLPSLMTLAADLYRVAGDPAAGLQCIQRAEQHVLDTGEMNGYVGLMRCKGELLLSTDPPNEAEAEALFVLGVDVAFERGDRLAELRATAMLVKFRHRRGIVDENRDRLTELCSWFDDDADIADLVEARKLLAKVGAAESASAG